MGPLERRLRALINPISTGLTQRWLGVGRRQVPARTDVTSPAPASSGPRSFRGVRSPGEWIAPSGQRPGWDWLPEFGASPNLRALPWWARVWYRLPFVDRYAYQWMWWHGGWSVWVPADPPPPPAAGVHEPRPPAPAGPSGSGAANAG